MKYTCLIADDQLPDLDALEMHLAATGLVDIVASCSNGMEASKVLAKESIDVVFTDIDMPGISGLDLVKNSRKNPVFVFISSHPEYAAESFNLDVVDFIVKPATAPRVMKAVTKAIEYLELKKSVKEQPLKQDNTASNDETHIFIRESHDLVKIRFEDVSYIESMGDFSKIHLLNDKKHITLVSLKHLEIQLPDHTFMRVHKQHMVNYHHITTIGAADVTTSANHQVPVGSSYRQQLLDKVVDKKIITRFS